MPQVCRQCSRPNPPEAVYCYFDGAVLSGQAANGGPVNLGSQPFPSQFVFPSGLVCRNFDQLAMACQQNWQAAVALLKQGFLAGFLGGLGRADLALTAQEAARFPDPDRGLDQLLAKLPSGVLETPKLQVEPREVSLGHMRVGQDRSLDLHLANLGMRLLYGSVVSDCKWLALGEAPGNPQRLFQFGAETVVPVQIIGKHLHASIKPLEGHLIIDSSGGSITVTVRAEVPIAPFKDGVLAGALTPRQIAEKAMAAPREAAVLFESGAVAHWYVQNGLTYPVKGPGGSGLHALQEFLEAYRWAKPPKVEITPTALTLRGQANRSVEVSLEVTAKEKKPVFAYATCDQPWVDVRQVQLNSRSPVALVWVRIANVPNRIGETLQATITVTANGNQQFQVPLSLTVVGGNPFEDLVPVPAGSPPAVAEDLVSVIPVGPADQSFLAEFAGLGADPVGSPAAGLTAGIPAGLPVSPPPAGGLAGPMVAPAAAPQEPGGTLSVAAPVGKRRERFPTWAHLIPLAVLGVVLIAVMVRDFSHGPAAQVERRLAVFFDHGSSPDKTVKLSQTLNFGLEMVDLTKTKTGQRKRLTFDRWGRTNSTVVSIDGQARLFGKGSGKWQDKPAKTSAWDGRTGTWQFFELIQVTQKVEIVPREDEVLPNKVVLDTCLVRYKIENKDNRPHKVGLRLLLDTYIGTNDGVPFTVPGVPGLIDTHKDFGPPRPVPDFIQARENSSLTDPGTVMQINFRAEGNLEPPARVSLTRHPQGNFYPHWEVPLADIITKVERKGGGKGDSAVVIYWSEEELSPGQTRELGFSFGLGSVVAGSDRLGMVVGGSFSPKGEITVVALVNDPQPEQKVTLKLPPEFQLLEEYAAKQDVPPAQKGADGRSRPSPVTWRVRSGEAGEYTLEVHSSTGGSQSKRVRIKARSLF
jgi:hypothetical protein